MYLPPENSNHLTLKCQNGNPKLVINDEMSLQQISDSIQSEPNYDHAITQQVQQPVYQPPQYQQSYQQSYQLPYSQPYQQLQYQQYQQPLIQQPIQYNPQINQIDPNMEQLLNQNNGNNQGQTKYLDYISLLFGPFNSCWTICLYIYLIILQFHINLTKLESVLFITSSICATSGFVYKFGILYDFYIIFQYYQIVTMVTALFYLLKIDIKPAAIEIIILSTLLLALTLVIIICCLIFYNVFDDSVVPRIFYIILWYFCCSVISFRLVNTLEKTYKGKNKKIQKDNIWTGFILFKLYFLFPEI
ncbi:hypothetical protein pb186bvf_017982 [Paramecium bursaria]